MNEVVHMKNYRERKLLNKHQNEQLKEKKVIKPNRKKGKNERYLKITCQNCRFTSSFLGRNLIAYYETYLFNNISALLEM